MVKPEIIYIHGDALVPAKALEFKRDHLGKVIERITPRTHNFENILNADLKKQLEGIGLFPTDKEVFISITHGINSKVEYEKLDLDNRAKTILDALKGVVYQDDSQVKILLTKKLMLNSETQCYYRFSVKILDSDCEKEITNSLGAVLST